MPETGAAHVQFFYSYVNDLAATRRFYADGLGLQVTMENPQFVELSGNGVKLVFVHADAPLEVETRFSSMPGWNAGDAQRALCSIEYGSREFRDVVRRLGILSVPTAVSTPVWRAGSWELPVLDPMGNTVELYSIAPQGGDWAD
jgi:catechol 2,3-dioxygenase-like lactoylglutathione lyase family enzyme